MSRREEGAPRPVGGEVHAPGATSGPRGGDDHAPGATSGPGGGDDHASGATSGSGGAADAQAGAGADADPRWDAFRAAWLVAAVARISLENMATPVVLPWTSLFLVGSAILWLHDRRIGWLACAIGALGPLLFAQDWLTQSVLVLSVAVAAVVAGAGAAMEVARGLLVSTYLLAAFHKLNRDFLDPAMSCANHGWTRLVETLPALKAIGATEVIAEVAPAATIGIELVIAALAIRRSLWLLPVAAFFHVPLTLALAPAFAFVMAVGWVACVRPSDWHRVVVAERRFRILHVAAAGMAVVASLWLSGGAVLPSLAAKTAALVWFGSVGLAAARGRGPAPVASAGASPIVPRWIAPAAAVAFIAWAATTYVGTQMQHTGAMLSNLRTDTGCWNHLIVPESVRWVDPWVRIDLAEMGRRGDARPFADRERILTTTLWSTTSLHTLRRNWCRARSRPIRVEGTWRGAPFVHEDLCAPDVELPRGPGVFGGDGWFDGYLRLQKNLLRECPARCVH